MMAEIYARGPIACSLNSDAPQFNAYQGGIITCKEGKECHNKRTDHVVVIAGWGYDEEKDLKFWIGRNSYGTQVIPASVYYLSYSCSGVRGLEVVGSDLKEVRTR